jgi:LPXTG-motif cell wall-anchored protein
MRSTRRTAAAILIAAAFTAMGAGPALADSTSGDGGVLSGNQVHAPVSVPVNACGNAVAVLGTARAACKGDATVANRAGGSRTSGNGSIGGGNQVDAPISAPVNACGNAVAVAGQAVAACKGHARVGNQPPGHHRGHLPPPHQPPGHHHHMPPPHQPPGHHHHHMPPPHQPPGHHHMPPPAHQPPGGSNAHKIGAPVPAHNAAQSLPFTGANTAGIAAAAAGALGLGAVSLWFARRRQRRAGN